MVEPKLFKTKLCVLYQKGRCTRQNCNFAHGDAELRRFSGSFRGRRDYGGRDLSDRLDWRRSPQRKYSPSQDVRGRDKFHECSPSKSLDKESDRKRRKKHHEDDQSNIPGSQRVSDGVEDFAKEGKIANDSRVLTEQLKKARSEVNKLDHRRSQLTVCLEEKVQEVDSLSSKIQELEAQLYGEKEENKRITMKIIKFVKTHHRHLQIQDQLKRSHSRLQKLGDELGSDVSKIAASGEDLSIDIVSDGETTGYLYSPCNKLQNGDLTKGHTAAPLRLRKLSRYELFVSMLEVYNEKIRDLLVDNHNQPAKKLETKQDAEGTQEVPGLVEACVFSTDDVWELLKSESQVRSVGSTTANELSSRSHCVQSNCQGGKSNEWTKDKKSPMAGRLGW